LKYHKRFVDHTLAERLSDSGAVLIVGPKGCGKTETAKQMARSSARFDTDEQVRVKMEIDPKMVLSGVVPRLLDEWQEYPQVWEYMRHEIDTRKRKGQFILTGSAAPDDKVNHQSGVGIVPMIRMRPMSFYEKGWSTGEVSLSRLIRGETPVSEPVSFYISEFAEMITLGGWPALIGAGTDTGLHYASDYISSIAETDISKVSNKHRDPHKVTRLLKSLASFISTGVTVTALTKDVGGSGDCIDDETATEYLSALERLMVVDNLPAWRPHIRTTDVQRKSPKRHFADPSLAIGALGLSVDKLISDLNYLGLLFKSLVVKDLKIYAEASGGKVYHYRDSRGMEIDSIVEYSDGIWGAFEIRLGIGAACKAAHNLLKFAAKIDTEKTQAPAALTVITGNGVAYRRGDGVSVVPLSVLTV